jgi:hypothetical protein
MPKPPEDTDDFDVTFAPDDPVLLVSPYSSQARALAQLGNMTPQARSAFFNAALAEDPQFEKFSTLVGLCAQKYGLKGGFVSDDLMLYVGDAAAMQIVATELGSVYEVTICTGREYLNYVSQVDDEADADDEPADTQTRTFH